MKNILLLFFSSILLFACSKKQSSEDIPFDKQKWMVAEEYTYPYRNSMLKDLIADSKLKKLKQDQILQLLGTPTREDNGHLFYKISQTRFGIFPISTKTLVIKFRSDSTVEWVKVHG